MALKVAFLDRDGTLNFDHVYIHRIDQWQLAPRAEDAVKVLRKMGFAIGVVSNQSGVAAGLYSDAEVETLHRHMVEQLASLDAAIDAVAYCPHGRDDACGCRKPRPGLAQKIAESLPDGVDYAMSWTIGDKLSDVEFGRAIGTHTALLRSRYWDEVPSGCKPDLIVDSLDDAAVKILEMS